jgi:cyclomaltodextrinase
MKRISILVVLSWLAFACSPEPTKQEAPVSSPQPELTHADWSMNATIYEANIRQMTPEGTFKAFEAQLPAIKELGTDIIWLMPIHPIGKLNRKGGMGSYYSVQDYKKVNPEFGTLQDLKDLVNAAHDLEMKVIIDWVANHTAWDHPWTVDHPEWYTQDSAGNFVPPVPDWSDVIDLNYDQKEMRIAMIDALTYWVKEADIDGYRCDVAEMVPTDFWNDARAALDQIKPVFMLAEAEKPELHEKAFDMSYGWELMHIMNHVAKGDSSVASLNRYMKREYEKFDRNDFRMNFLTNHDENSWNGTIAERYGDAEKPFAVLAFTIHGMPLIYSGQEYGNDKRLAFFEKDTPNFAHPDRFDFYKVLLQLNRSNKALWNGKAGGEYLHLETSLPDKVLAYQRVNGETAVSVAINFTAEPVEAILQDKQALQGTDVFTGVEVDPSTDGRIYLPPFGYLVLENTTSNESI